MFGGTVVVAISFGAVAVWGGVGSHAKTVTVIAPAPIAPAAVSHDPSEPIAREVYERDAPGVVFVNASGVDEVQSADEYLRGENGGQGTATGSGFEIDGDGRILTNWHVVQGTVKITVGLEHGKSVQARLIGKDASHDIAVLRIPTSGLTLHPLEFGDSSKATVGDPVLAIGNPFGLTRTLTT